MYRSPMDEATVSGGLTRYSIFSLSLESVTVENKSVCLPVWRESRRKGSREREPVADSLMAVYARDGVGAIFPPCPREFFL